MSSTRRFKVSKTRRFKVSKTRRFKVNSTRRFKVQTGMIGKVYNYSPWLILIGCCTVEDLYSKNFLM